MRKKFLRKFKFRLQLFLITLKRVRTGVWISFFVAILGAMNYEVGFIPLTLDNNFTRSTNAIINQILLTYITGLVFYFLIELLYVTKKKISAFVSIANNVFLVVERAEYILNEIGKTNKGEENNFDLNSTTFADFCDNINIEAQKVNVWFYPEYTIKEFIVRSCEEIKAASEEILAFSELLDEKWVYSLSKISGLCTKTIHGFDIRFSKPKIQSYYLWGLYAETGRLHQLQKKYDKDYFKLERLNAELFHPIGLTFKVDRSK